MQQGTLKLAGPSATQTLSSVTLGGTGTSGTSMERPSTLTVAALATAGTSANQTITNNSLTTNASLIYAGNSISTFGGVIQNGAAKYVSLSVTGGGTLVLANTNAFTGGAIVANGTVRLGRPTGGLGVGALTLGGSGTAGTIDLNGFNQAFSSFSLGAGAIAADQLIGNSSTTSDGTLTLNTIGTTTIAVPIRDIIGGGSRQLGVVFGGAARRSTFSAARILSAVRRRSTPASRCSTAGVGGPRLPSALRRRDRCCARRFDQFQLHRCGKPRRGSFR